MVVSSRRYTPGRRALAAALAASHLTPHTVLQIGQLIALARCVESCSHVSHAHAPRLRRRIRRCRTDLYAPSTVPATLVRRYLRARRSAAPTQCAWQSSLPSAAAASGAAAQALRHARRLGGGAHASRRSGATRHPVGTRGSPHSRTPPRCVLASMNTPVRGEPDAAVTPIRKVLISLQNLTTSNSATTPELKACVCPQRAGRRRFARVLTARLSGSHKFRMQAVTQAAQYSMEMAEKALQQREQASQANLVAQLKEQCACPAPATRDSVGCPCWQRRRNSSRPRAAGARRQRGRREPMTACVP